MLTRRFVLAAIATTAGAAALKAAPAVPAAAPVAAAPVKPPLLAWTVGTPGEFNWEIVHAATEQEAIKEWLYSNGDEVECGYPEDEDAPAPDPHRECVCGECYGPEVWATRQPAFDERRDVTPADWIRQGIGHVCCRCGEETSPEVGAMAIGDEAVCEDCVTREEFEAALAECDAGGPAIPSPTPKAERAVPTSPGLPLPKAGIDALAGLVEKAADDPPMVERQSAASLTVEPMRLEARTIEGEVDA